MTTRNYDPEKVLPEAAPTPESIRDMACQDCMSRGTFALQPVEEVIQLGNDTAIVTIEAAVCGVCGNRTYSPEVERQMEAVQQALQEHNLSALRPVGTTYRPIVLPPSTPDASAN